MGLREIDMDGIRIHVIRKTLIEHIIILNCEKHSPITAEFAVAPALAPTTRLLRYWPQNVSNDWSPAPAFVITAPGIWIKLCPAV